MPAGAHLPIAGTDRQAGPESWREDEPVTLTDLMPAVLLNPAYLTELAVLLVIAVVSVVVYLVWKGTVL